MSPIEGKTRSLESVDAGETVDRDALDTGATTRLDDDDTGQMVDPAAIGD